MGGELNCSERDRTKPLRPIRETRMLLLRNTDETRDSDTTTTTPLKSHESKLLPSSAILGEQVLRLHELI